VLTQQPGYLSQNRY